MKIHLLLTVFFFPITLPIMAQRLTWQMANSTNWQTINPAAWRSTEHPQSYWNLNLNYRYIWKGVETTIPKSTFASLDRTYDKGFVARWGGFVYSTRYSNFEDIGFSGNISFRTSFHGSDQYRKVHKMHLLVGISPGIYEQRRVIRRNDFANSNDPQIDDLLHNSRALTVNTGVGLLLLSIHAANNRSLMSKGDYSLYAGASIPEIITNRRRYYLMGGIYRVGSVGALEANVYLRHWNSRSIPNLPFLESTSLAETNFRYYIRKLLEKKDDGNASAYLGVGYGLSRYYSAEVGLRMKNMSISIGYQVYSNIRNLELALGYRFFNGK